MPLDHPPRRKGETEPANDEWLPIAGLTVLCNPDNGCLIIRSVRAENLHEAGRETRLAVVALLSASIRGVVEAIVPEIIEQGNGGALN